MNIGIVDTAEDYSARWRELTNTRGWRCHPIDPRSNDIIAQIRALDVFFWRVLQFRTLESLAARHVISACEILGVRCFPSSNTLRCYDDKLSQKYILESIDAPLVKTHLFYDRADALAWAKQTDFPKVFKLKCGAGSQNVRLVKSYSEARKLIDTAFSSGFPAAGGNVQDALGKVKAGSLTRKEILDKLWRSPSTIARIRQNNRECSRERGYILFQDFVPNNEFDTRITVIGSRAVAFRRAVRKNDFRASGSGVIDYNQEEIDTRCIEIGFDMASRLKSQSLCVDFVHSQQNEPFVVEISYTYVSAAVAKAGGYWTDDLDYVPTPVSPPDAIFEDCCAGL